MSDAKQLSRILPYFFRGRFNNYQNEASEDSLSRSILMYFSSLLVRHKDDKKIINSWYQPSNVINNSIKPRVTWLGHSTFLIQINGKNILTDPVLSNLTFLFKRVLPCGILLGSLPIIDYVIISHNHRDHMDSLSLKGLKKRFPQMHVLVPRGDKQWFDRRGFARVSEYMWWEQFENSELKITFLPAFHWSQRGLFDRNKSLWGSWMIEGAGSSIYFAGDTAYADHFKRISYYFPSIDIALMPIGPCEPRMWMKRSHVNAEEAGQAFLDLNAFSFIPMHWGSFYFGVDSFLAPVERLESWWNQNKTDLIGRNLLLSKAGQAQEFDMPTHAVEPQKTIVQP